MPPALIILKKARVDLNIHQNSFVLDLHGTNNISPSLSSLLRNLSNGVSLLGTWTYSERSMPKTVTGFPLAALGRGFMVPAGKIPSRMHGSWSNMRLARGEVHGVVRGVLAVWVLWIRQLIQGLNGEKRSYLEDEDMLQFAKESMVISFSMSAPMQEIELFCVYFHLCMINYIIEVSSSPRKGGKTSSELQQDKSAPSIKWRRSRAILHVIFCAGQPCWAERTSATQPGWKGGPRGANFRRGSPLTLTGMKTTQHWKQFSFHNIRKIGF